MRVSASFLGSNHIASTLQKLNLTDVDYIHVDVMDGKYVLNKSLPFSEMSKISNYTRKRLDVHLMVKAPLKYIDNYATLNTEFLTVHLNTKNSIEDVIKRCADFGIKVGIAIKPQEDVSLVFPYLSKISLVLLMSVEPGLPGQEFMMSVLPKIALLKEEIKKQNVKTLISIDGGVNLLNIKYLKEVDIVVSGSAIIKSDNFQDTITKLRG